LIRRKTLEVRSRLVVGAALLAVALLAPASAAAQRTYIEPFFGWRVGGSVVDVSRETVEYDVETSSSWGFVIGNDFWPDRGLELLYSTQSTEIEARSLDGTVVPIGLRVDQYMFGGRQTYRLPEPWALPFVTGYAGLTRLSSSTGDVNDGARFAIGAGTGITFAFSPRVGLQLLARGYLTFVNESVAVACSGGCVVRFAGSSFVQGDLGGGLSVRF
jgi:hypothetical protein